MQIGPSINKNASINLVSDTHWNGYCELARMAFDDYLPKNSESRCISIMLKLIKKQAPHIEWMVSYADGAQCGDGAIYRASGFHLIDIKKNTSMWRMPNGDVVCGLIFNPGFSPNSKNDQSIKYGKKGLMATWPATKFLNHIGALPIPGYQLKYVYFLNSAAKKRLNAKILPFSRIEEMGAGMYKGKKVSLQERKQAREVHMGEQLASSQKEGGSIPTLALQTAEKQP
jgi:hypothetical protein